MLMTRQSFDCAEQDGILNPTGRKELLGATQHAVGLLGITNRDRQYSPRIDFDERATITIAWWEILR